MTKNVTRAQELVRLISETPQELQSELWDEVRYRARVLKDWTVSDVRAYTSNPRLLAAWQR